MITNGYVLSCFVNHIQVHTVAFSENKEPLFEIKNLLDSAKIEYQTSDGKIHKCYYVIETVGFNGNEIKIIKSLPESQKILLKLR